MSETWTRYYEYAGDDPRGTLLLALERFEAEGRRGGFAVDLGAGAGRDTAELLRRGWRVLAIDAEPDGIDRLQRAVPDSERVETLVARFEEAEWPSAELVNSSFALPFCPPDAFPRLWRRIEESLAPGGRFAGQLFGDRDGWSPEEDMSFHTRAEAESLFEAFELERFHELEEDGRVATGAPKHWHVFHVVARKR